MTRPEIIQKYRGSINEALELAIANEYLSLSNIREKYGVSARWIWFITAVKKILIRSNKRGYYSTNRKEYYTDIEIQMLMNELNALNTKIKEKKRLESILIPKEEDRKLFKLDQVPTEKLIEELKHRGFTGTITRKEDIIF
jgi:hypothetical protein